MDSHRVEIRNRSRLRARSDSIGWFPVILVLVAIGLTLWLIATGRVAVQQREVAWRAVLLLSTSTSVFVTFFLLSARLRRTSQRRAVVWACLLSLYTNLALVLFFDRVDVPAVGRRVIETLDPRDEREAVRFRWHERSSVTSVFSPVEARSESPTMSLEPSRRDESDDAIAPLDPEAGTSAAREVPAPIRRADDRLRAPDLPRANLPSARSRQLHAPTSPTTSVELPLTDRSDVIPAERGGGGVGAITHNWTAPDLAEIGSGELHTPARERVEVPSDRDRQGPEIPDSHLPPIGSLARDTRPGIETPPLQLPLPAHTATPLQAPKPQTVSHPMPTDLSRNGTNWDLSNERVAAPIAAAVAGASSTRRALGTDRAVPTETEFLQLTESRSANRKASTPSVVQTIRPTVQGPMARPVAEPTVLSPQSTPLGRRDPRPLTAQVRGETTSEGRLADEASPSSKADALGPPARRHVAPLVADDSIDVIGRLLPDSRRAAAQVVLPQPEIEIPRDVASASAARLDQSDVADVVPIADHADSVPHASNRDPVSRPSDDGITDAPPSLVGRTVRLPHLVEDGAGVVRLPAALGKSRQPTPAQSPIAEVERPTLLAGKLARVPDGFGPEVGRDQPATLHGMPAKSLDHAVVDLVAPEGAGGLDRLAHRPNRPGRSDANSAVTDVVSDLPRQRFPRREVSAPAWNSVTPAPSAAPAFAKRSERLGRDLENPRQNRANEAIERGLEFLVRHQRPDGSWWLDVAATPDQQPTIESPAAATGLALLCFLGGGYHHQQGVYEDVVDRGLRFLIAGQQASGDLFVPHERAGNAWLYSHAVAAMAICEAYGMTRDANLKVPAQRALDFIVAAQQSETGGWRYRPGVESDTSVTGWMVMALRSGELAGLEVSDAVYDRVNRWMEQAAAGADRPYLYRYNPYAGNTDEQRHGRVPSRAMTAVGLLIRLYTGGDPTDQDYLSGVEHLLRASPSLGTRRAVQRDAYLWYYATLAVYYSGGTAWNHWVDELAKVMIPLQITTGQLAGSWDPDRPVPDRWGGQAGRLYVSAMCLLTLEVEYRRLPHAD